MLAFRDNRITDYLTLAQNRQTRWSAAGFLSFIFASRSEIMVDLAALYQRACKFPLPRAP